MIHFDFVVDDVDAENIINCIHSEICKCHEDIMDCMVEGGKEEYIAAYRDRIQYLKELIVKMHNSWVEE